MRNPFFLLLFFLALFLSGCSWVERFVVYNTSSEVITIQYTISDHQHGFPLFDRYVDAYQLKNKTTIDWYQPITVEDLDTTALSFHFELPPNTVLVFGNLHNDTYEQYHQEFNNDRYFNLEKLEISGSTKKITTTPEGFDQIFTKKKGIIGYTVH